MSKAADHQAFLTSISDVSVALPSFAEIFSVLTFQAGFNSAVVVLGTALLGVAAGTIGAFALLRKRALMGDALAHSALPGLAAAFIIGSLSGFGGKNIWLLLLGATISGILGVICVQLIVRYSRLSEDTAIGAVLSCFFGAGVLLMSVIQSLGTGEEGGLQTFIYGQTAAMNRSDAYLTFGASIIALGICSLLLKEFRLICFDDEFAAADGWAVSRIDLVMMSVVVLVTVIGLQAVGLLLIVALLVIPAAAARFWTDNLVYLLIASSIIGGASGYLGSATSALQPRLPAGAVIVLVAGTIFFLSFMFAPKRGVISLLLAQTKLSLRVSTDHVLRELYEAKELRGLDYTKDFLTLESVKLFSSWNIFYRTFFLWLMQSSSYLEIRASGGSKLVRFTDKGAREAAAKVRNHRMWEEYLVSYAHLPVSHVDYSADLVEHVLSKDILERLESKLRERGRDISQDKLPASLHPLEKELV